MVVPDSVTLCMQCVGKKTIFSGPWKLAFVVTLLAILLHRSTLAETEDTESLYTESTPPLPQVEEEEEVGINFYLSV